MNASTRPLVLTSEAPPLHQDEHGVVRVAGTRVTLDSLIALFEQGASAEEITLRYDVLSLRDVYAALSYFLGHQREMRAYLKHSRQQSLAARRDAEMRSSTAQIRERLRRFRQQHSRQPDAESAG